MSELRCFGCGAVAAPDAWACAHRGDDVDHVLRRALDTFAAPDAAQTQPFLRYRHRLHSWHRAQAAGWTDAAYLEAVETLDRAIAKVDGKGFRTTPVGALPALAKVVGVAHLEAKDETRNVGASHKARHLFGLALHLLVSGEAAPKLAIASCGNAALAASVVAKAAGWPLAVFIPADAKASVVEQLEALGGDLVICPREADVAGDPTYLAFRGAVEAGAVPFCCQGPDNGLNIEGGMTLGYEWVEHWLRVGRVPDHVVVQVGGGALGSAIGAAIAEAVAAGVLKKTPKLHVVQTEGAWPLKRAIDRLRETGTSVADAIKHRADYMWPWETAPRSLAHGILDDETYDWAALAEQVIATGGTAVLADETTLAQARTLAQSADVPASYTGAAGLAGAILLVQQGMIDSSEHVAVVLSGLDRDRSPDQA